MIVTGDAYRDLSQRLEPEMVAEWTRAERNAMDMRGETLHIYDVTLDEGTLP